MMGKECGEFTLEKEIGKGTFGVVYIATRTEERQSCFGTSQPSSYALKMVNLSQANKKEKEMVGREAKLLKDLKQFQHRNIVKYIDFFSYKTYTCIVMEYCERGTLYEYVRKHKVVPENRFIDILRQITQGLAFLHDKDILHRDIKSKNILIDGHNVIKIGDFGVARELEKMSPEKMSIMVGSPQYMSPEMLSLKPYDEKTDIWSLGCTCYEMGTGDYAFHAKNINEIKKLVAEEKLPPMRDADYCDNIKRLIMSMLQKESAHRPNARQVLEVIGKHKCSSCEDDILKLSLREHHTKSPRVLAVSPRPKSPKPERIPQIDSGLSSGSITPNTIVSPSSTLSSSASTFTPSLIEKFHSDSSRYQSKLVRLIGDNRASDKVAKIKKVLLKYPQNYDKIKETVKKYVREDRYKDALAIVFALKGAQEAINQMTLEQDGGPSTSTSDKSDT